MSLRIAYRRVLGLIAAGMFEIPSKSAVWYQPSEWDQMAFSSPVGLFWSSPESGALWYKSKRRFAPTMKTTFCSHYEGWWSFPLFHPSTCSCLGSECGRQKLYSLRGGERQPHSFRRLREVIMAPSPGTNFVPNIGHDPKMPLMDI
jgi:hypothetical protein